MPHPVLLLRHLYLATLLAMPLMLHRVETPPEPENPVYSLRTDTAINSKLIDRQEEKTSAIERHLDATDARVQADSNRIATWEGGAGASVAILGILQVLGLVQQFRPKPKAELKTEQLVQILSLANQFQPKPGIKRDD